MYPDNNMNNNGFNNNVDSNVNNNGFNQNNFNMQSNNMNNVPLQNNQVNYNNGVNSNNQNQINNMMYSNNNQNSMENKPKNNKKVLLIVTLFVLILAIILVVVLVIGNKDNNTDDVDNNLSNDNSQIIDDNDEDDDNMNTNNVGYWNPPTYDIYFTYPKFDDWYADRNITRSIGYLNKMKDGKLNSNHMVTLSYMTGVTLDESEKNDLENFLKKYYHLIFTNYLASYSDARLMSSELEITSSEKLKISGFDCLKFDGKVTETNVDEAKRLNNSMYGYFFKVDDVYILVSGLITTKEEDVQLKKEINAVVDKIAYTIKTEK